MSVRASSALAMAFALAGASVAAHAEIAVSSNDAHTVTVNGQQIAAEPVVPDTLSIVDLAKYPPQVTATIDVVAGGETAGIPFAAWLADRMMLPMQYIRKKPKGFGRNAQIEGDLHPGGRALLVEDLATDGRSKVNFCNALREAQQSCAHVFVFFFYDIFPHAREEMEELGVRLHYLATWWDVLRVARENEYFATRTLDEVESFLKQPAEWSAAHGGISEFKAAG